MKIKKIVFLFAMLVLTGCIKNPYNSSSVSSPISESSYEDGDNPGSYNW